MIGGKTPQSKCGCARVLSEVFLCDNDLGLFCFSYKDGGISGSVVVEVPEMKQDFRIGK